MSRFLCFLRGLEEGKGWLCPKYWKRTWLLSDPKAKNIGPRTNYAVKYATARGHLLKPYSAKPYSARLRYSADGGGKQHLNSREKLCNPPPFPSFWPEGIFQGNGETPLLYTPTPRRVFSRVGGVGVYKIWPCINFSKLNI